MADGPGPRRYVGPSSESTGSEEGLFCHATDEVTASLAAAMTRVLVCPAWELPVAWQQLEDVLQAERVAVRRRASRDASSRDT